MKKFWLFSVLILFASMVLAYNMVGTWDFTVCQEDNGFLTSWVFKFYADGTVKKYSKEYQEWRTTAFWEIKNGTYGDYLHIKYWLVESWFCADLTLSGQTFYNIKGAGEMIMYIYLRGQYRYARVPLLMRMVKQ